MPRKTERKPKKDEIIVVRVPKSHKEKIKRIAGSRGVSWFINTLIKAHLRTIDKHRSAYYRCDSCNKTLEVNEPYYCELANKEKFVVSEENPEELEIEVIDSMPKKILCMHCAKKQGKLKCFKEPFPDTNETFFVKDSSRICNI